jgi:hypothetical protein
MIVRKLNYEKADIWSLGKILHDLIPHCNDSLTNEHRTLIEQCYAMDPSKRLSCHDAHQRSKRLINTLAASSLNQTNAKYNHSE